MVNKNRKHIWLGMLLLAWPFLLVLFFSYQSSCPGDMLGTDICAFEDFGQSVGPVWILSVLFVLVSIVMWPLVMIYWFITVKSNRLLWAGILSLSCIQLVNYFSYPSLAKFKFFLADPAAYTYQIIFKNQGFWLQWVTGFHLIFLVFFFIAALWNVFRQHPYNVNWVQLLTVGVLVFWPVFINFVVFPIVFVTGMDCLWNPDCL